MITIGIDPIIVSLGFFSISWHAAMSVVAIVIAIPVGLRETRRRGIADEDVYSLLPWAIVGGIVGARLFHVVDKFGYYVSNPSAIIAFQEGGLAIYGAIIGGIGVGSAYARLRSIPVGRLGDAMAPALILGQAVGRVGCLINGDVFGAPANLPWAVAYTHPNSLAPKLGVPAHPAAAYELLWDLIVFGILWKLRMRSFASGTLLCIYFLLYAIGRFVISFFREDTLVLLALSQAQVIALGAMIAPTLLVVLLNTRQQFRRQGWNIHRQTDA
ncbi:MAG: prolipoprotein diacylglyceryl transferase [Chloroflexi bacterium]|nr:prolipoprotein diacylglyceryl transferase [Chloroflexota bacterium]